jgi:trehalose 6-phosphate synthase/phosphatase
MEKIFNKGKLEFALVIGDDHCDEPMLSVMRQVGRRASEARIAKKGGQPLAPLPATIAQVDVSSCDEYISSNLKCFTSTVGKKPTAAANYLNDVEDVHELLESLVKVTTRETVHSGFYSVVDLKKMDESPTTPDRESIKFDAQTSWQRSLSMCQLHTPDTSGEPTDVRVSTNLDEYLGTMQEDVEDEDNFF